MPVGLQHSEIPLDATVILFTATLSLVTGFLFGLAPAIQSSKLELTETLKESSTATSEGKSRHRLRRLLVISEMALAMLLLVGAGLMIKSLYKLQKVDLGFNPSNVLTMRLSLPRTIYPKPYTQRAVFDGLMDRLHGLPNVNSVGIVNYLPLSGSNNRRNVQVEGAPENPINVEFHLESESRWVCCTLPSAGYQSSAS
jgi:putative ABC transport system permease protein